MTQDIAAWFDFYNTRQTVEAGIKEGKNVFQMHHLKVHSTAGLMIQEEFAVLAANLVRWAAAWLYQTCANAPKPFGGAQPNVKQVVFFRQYDDSVPSCTIVTLKPLLARWD